MGNKLGSDNPFPSVLLVHQGSAPSTPATDTVRLFVDDADGHLKFKDDGGTIVDLQAASGLSDHSAFTYLDATDGAAPSTPASGHARIYAKSDGRIYSKDDTGTEFGPFSAAGGGGGGGSVYSQPFSAASDPAGWAFTGSGSRATPGGTIDFTGAAQSDRYVYSYTPGSDLISVKLHLKNITNPGGMPSLCVLNSSGNGIGIGPYNDGLTYLWKIASYAYNATAGGGQATLGTTDLYLSLLLTKGGHFTLGADSLDGVTWRALGSAAYGSDLVPAYAGAIQAFSSANPTFKLDQFDIFEM